jgi:hypothetical protein
MTAVASDRVQAIPTILRRLRETDPPHGRVLSVTLDTTASRTIGMAYVLAFRDACKRVRSELAESEWERFERAVARTERYLAESLVPGRPGVAIYAGGNEDYFFATPLPTAPPDLVAWEPAPVLAPLLAALDDQERVAVVLFDKERTRILSLYLDEIERRLEFQDEVPGKQATGDWFALSQTRYARHHEDHVLRHAKRTVASLMAELRRRPFDRLFLAGPDEARSLLLHHLPRPLGDRFAGALRLEVFATDAEVLAAARSAAADIERREELASVRALLDAATRPSVAIGAEPVLAALAAGRVHRLLVAGDRGAPGRACPTCARLWTEGETCPVCGGRTEPVGDLRERALQTALALGAKIEHVSGEAANLLEQHGGLGAWTRY